MNKIRHVKIISPVMVSASMPSIPNVSFSSENYYTGTDSSYEIQGSWYDSDLVFHDDELSKFIRCQYCGVETNAENIYCVGCGAPIDHSREEAEDVQSET